MIVVVWRSSFDVELPVALSGGWNDSHLPHSTPVPASDGGLPWSGHAGSNVVDDNSFLGHEVGAWKGLESPWRGDNRTSMLQPVDNGQLLDQEVQPGGCFRIVDGDLSFTANDRNWAEPGRGELIVDSRGGQEYDSRQQPGLTNMRSAHGYVLPTDQGQRSREMLDGSGTEGDRYPSLHEDQTWNSAAGLGFSSLLQFVAE